MTRSKLILVAVAMLSPLVAMAQESYPPPASTPQEATTTAEPAASSEESLPATASPLPLFALGSVGTLAAGVWLTRRRRS